MPVDAAAVAKLQQACDKAAALYPNSCSHSVWYVIQQYLPDQPWMNANALMDHVQGQRHVRLGNAGHERRVLQPQCHLHPSSQSQWHELSKRRCHADCRAERWYYRQSPAESQHKRWHDEFQQRYNHESRENQHELLGMSL